MWAGVWGSHGRFPLAGRVTTEPGRQWFPRMLPPWLSLLCVRLCFPRSEPGIFSLSIFSPGTLDHPGVQNWTEVSGTVWCTPGFALRSVRFWRWFLRMGCAAFWGWLPFRWLGWPAPHCVSAHVALWTPVSPTPSSQDLLYVPLFPPSQPCFSPLTGLHCPSITVPCGRLSL